MIIQQHLIYHSLINDISRIVSPLNSMSVFRSQKHYPAPLAIPLPNYSYDQAGKDMMERQASQRFGTIPRVSTIHDRNKSDRVSTRANSERGNARSCNIESSEDDAYLANSSIHTRFTWLTTHKNDL